MEHARDIELIELAAGGLGAGRKAAVLSHLQGCARCREKFESVRQTWDILGAWEVRPSDKGAVTSEPRTEPARRRATWVFHLPMALRVAAIVVVAVFAGYTSGRWSTRRAGAPSEISPPAYISALELDVGQSLSSLVLQDEPSSEEG